MTDHDAFAKELAALRAGRGFVDVSDRHVVRVRGADAVRWLHDLLTADIAGLSPGAACRSLLLSPTGHVRADVQVMPATGLKTAQLRHSALPGLKSGRGKSG